MRHSLRAALAVTVQKQASVGPLHAGGARGGHGRPLRCDHGSVAGERVQTTEHVAAV